LSFFRTSLHLHGVLFSNARNRNTPCFVYLTVLTAMAPATSDEHVTLITHTAIIMYRNSRKSRQKMV